MTKMRWITKYYKISWNYLPSHQQKVKMQTLLLLLLLSCISGLCFGYLLLYFVLDRILQHGVIWRQLISKPVTSKQWFVYICVYYFIIVCSYLIINAVHTWLSQLHLVFSMHTALRIVNDSGRSTRLILSVDKLCLCKYFLKFLCAVVSVLVSYV